MPSDIVTLRSGKSAGAEDGPATNETPDRTEENEGLLLIRLSAHKLDSHGVLKRVVSGQTQTELSPCLLLLVRWEFTVSQV